MNGISRFLFGGCVPDALRAELDEEARDDERAVGDRDGADVAAHRRGAIVP